MRTQYRNTLKDVDTQLAAAVARRDRARTPDEWQLATIRIDALLEQRHELNRTGPS